jgi:hypothetical protein
MAIAFLFANYTQAADWQLLTTSNKFDTAYLIDISSIKFSIDNPQIDMMAIFWQKEIYREPKIYQNKLYYYEMNRINMNCTRQKYRIEDTVLYDKDGQNIAEDSYPGNWGIIVPDTVSDEMFRVICKGGEENKNPKPQIKSKDKEIKYL